jgi:hypothetical protein
MSREQIELWETIGMVLVYLMLAGFFTLVIILVRKFIRECW